MQHESSVQLFRNFQPLRNKKKPILSTFAWQLSNIPHVSFFFAFFSAKVEKLSGSNGMPIKLVKLPTCFLIMDGFLVFVETGEFFFFLSFNRFSYDEEYLLQKLIRCFSKINFRKKNHTNFCSFRYSQLFNNI